jgi:hypothetical protein
MFDKKKCSILREKEVYELETDEGSTALEREIENSPREGKYMSAVISVCIQ